MTTTASLTWLSKTAEGEGWAISGEGKEEIRKVVEAHSLVLAIERSLNKGGRQLGWKVSLFPLEGKLIDLQAYQLEASVTTRNRSTQKLSFRRKLGRQAPHVIFFPTEEWDVLRRLAIQVRQHMSYIEDVCVHATLK